MVLSCPGAVPDNWNFNSGNPCLHAGGNYNQNQNHGLFYVNYNTATNSNANIGCRILVKAIRLQFFCWLGGLTLSIGTGGRTPHGEDKPVRT
jgi:hypothetical protein